MASAFAAAGVRHRADEQNMRDRAPRWASTKPIRQGVYLRHQGHSRRDIGPDVYYPNVKDWIRRMAG